MLSFCVATVQLVGTTEWFRRFCVGAEAGARPQVGRTKLSLEEAEERSGTVKSEQTGAVRKPRMSDSQERENREETAKPG
jgi:hypothetical protein